VAGGGTKKGSYLKPAAFCMGIPVGEQEIGEATGGDGENCIAGAKKKRINCPIKGESLGEALRPTACSRKEILGSYGGGTAEGAFLPIVPEPTSRRA